MQKRLLADNRKLVEKFGAKEISTLKDVPDFYAFKRGLVYSHRDFDKFYAALKKGEKCAIVSGVNASGTLHIGHKVVFDTNLFFQKKYGVPVFIPISDDESYVAGKVKTQEEALENSMRLAKELLAYGFDPKKTYLIIDQIYTNIYNFAIKLSRRVTLSEIIASYGYKKEDNPGLYFYPAVQSAHVLLPQEIGDFKHVLVPIGPDEDSHLRIARDIASRAKYNKPAVLHLSFLPGIDGEKMSKSRNNNILFDDDEKTLRKKANKALSGGRETAELQRKYGGDPEKDMACFYLSKIFLSEKEGEKLIGDYRSGKLLSGDVKKIFGDELVKFATNFQKSVKKISDKKVNDCLMKNN
ncbi:tryptophan--tRNA ligase [Candidatus Woesearchaeota archaeon]|jgi:tryptophanyl-tRNA synthetase|nr:tryptophan--tRNA ligase [Candidatus Woesearchaeota archaeon]MBT4208329.1 tryptophan--tRNA ligase [Candidatus Woesearchaeota archaeon]